MRCANYNAAQFRLATLTRLRSIDMTCAGSVARFCCTLGVFAIGFASVAQAAGVDRKAYRAARENRVEAAAASNVEKKMTAKADALSPPQQRYVLRLVSAAEYTLNYEHGVIAAENRLIATQNSVIRKLSNAVNPRRITALEDQGLSLQATINRDLSLINAVQPEVTALLAALAPFVADGRGIAATYNRLEKILLVDEKKIAAIASRPPFTVPPATPGI
jgi:hypothetical protein